MKKFLSAATALAVLLIAGSPPTRALDSTVQFPFSTHAGIHVVLAFDLGVQQTPFSVESTTDTSATYSNGTYKVQITETATAFRSILRVQIQNVAGNDNIQLGSFSISARVSRTNIAGIWYPSADVGSNAMVVDGNSPINGISDAHFGEPYVAAVASSLRNVFALGLGRQDAAVSILGTPVDGGLYEFTLKAHTPRVAKSFDESFYVSADNTQNWFDKASRYADWVDELTNYRPFPFSPRAFDPIYDTWYWSGDQVDQSLYLTTARLASSVGARLYLADAGWDTDSGEYYKWLGGKTGDYLPSPRKFPDLAGTFNALRSDTHMGVQLWMQPFAVGRASVRYAATQNLHIHIPSDVRALPGWYGLIDPPGILPAGQTWETVNLCPRLDATVSYLRNLVAEMAAKYKPDGYWLDFIDGMSSTCVAPHNHNSATFGEGLQKSLDAIKRTILENNPQAVVHFRARYANLNNKSYANVWQSDDSPGDFDRMRLTALRLRPFSKGVVFASDQLYWKESLPEASVGRFIMTSVMTGVPAIGADLRTAPETTFIMVKEWLKFYDTYQSDLTSGHIVPFGQLTVPNHKIEAPTRTFVYLRNLATPDVFVDTRNVFLMNASDTDTLPLRLHGPLGEQEYSVQVLNRYLARSGAPTRFTTNRFGVASLNLVVEQGGMAIVSPAPPAPFSAY